MAIIHLKCIFPLFLHRFRASWRLFFNLQRYHSSLACPKGVDRRLKVLVIHWPPGVPRGVALNTVYLGAALIPNELEILSRFGWSFEFRNVFSSCNSSLPSPVGIWMSHYTV